MARYVTLVRNPRRRSRRRRNPDALALVKRNVPSLEEIGGAALGATVAMQLPALVKAASPWKAVAYSAVGTIAGGIALRYAKVGGAITNAYVLGAGVITALKAAHAATGGQFGIAPSQTVTSLMLPKAGSTGLSRLAPHTQGAHAGVATFRESEFVGAPQAELPESALV